MSAARLTWTQVTIGTGYRGYLTGMGERIRVASVTWGVSKRNDPKPWKLRTSLPGYESQREFATVEEAQECAERIVATFGRIINRSIPAS